MSPGGVVCLLLWLVLSGIEGIFDHKVHPSCSQHLTVCEFSFVITKRSTLTFMNRASKLTTPIVQLNGTFYTRTPGGASSCDDITPATHQATTQSGYIYDRPANKNDAILFTEVENSFPGDGRYVMTYFINDQFPGPNIVVYEGQQVKVSVTNRLKQEGVSIHWHGMLQHHTPWMDGVSGITQCPINPEETFTYRFVATPVGTAWYHSHYGLQAGDGLYGALIVLPRPQNHSSYGPMELQKNQDEMTSRGDNFKHSEKNTDLPLFTEEFVLFISDWFEEETANKLNRQLMSLQRFDGGNRDLKNCLAKTLSDDGTEVGTLKFESALFNGKGRYDCYSEVPLERFVVRRGHHYRFRVISAAINYPFRISVDQHKLKVIATDGGNISPVDADYVFIHGGERYDFYLHANESGNFFWIRGEALEKYYQLPLPWLDPNKQVKESGTVRAVLQYREEDQEEKPNIGKGTALTARNTTTKYPDSPKPSTTNQGVGLAPKQVKPSARKGSITTGFSKADGLGGTENTTIPMEQGYPITYDKNCTADRPCTTFTKNSTEPTGQRYPTTYDRNCTAASPCTTVNCPFQMYADSRHIICINTDELRSVHDYQSHRNSDRGSSTHDTDQTSKQIQEIIFNFHFAYAHKNGQKISPLVNGHKFVLPSAPPTVQPYAKWDYPCGDDTCDNHQCMCTYTEKLRYGSTIQLVLWNSFSELPQAAGANPKGRDAVGHPVHLHGHRFSVVKVGYPTYNNNTGIIEAANPDIRCPTERCESPEWSDPSWAGGRAPGINLDHPVVKDTVIIPAAGYVVVRFEADNPGWWYLHCHLLVHSVEGWAVLLQEGNFQDMAGLPPSFPTCGSWSLIDNQFNSSLPARNKFASHSRNISSLAWIVVVVITILVIVFGLLIAMVRRETARKIGLPSYGSMTSQE